MNLFFKNFLKMTFRKTFFLILLLPALLSGQWKGRTESGKLVVVKDQSAPSISLLTPRAADGDSILTDENFITVEGNVADNSGIKSFTLNDKEVSVSQDGSFKEQLLLNEGVNPIALAAEDFENNLSTLSFFMNYSPDRAGPDIKITAPIIALNPDDSIIVALPKLAIEGAVSDKDGVSDVKINGQRALLLSDNSFNADFYLAPGINLITVEAFDKNQNVSSLKFKVYFEDDVTGPVITILEPDVQRGIKIVKKSELVQVVGSATDESGIYDVTVNNRKAVIDAYGKFRLDIALNLGDNIIIVQARDLKYNTSVDTFIVQRQLRDVITTGKFYAFVVGINSYEGFWPSLRNARHDAEGMVEILKKNYIFDEFITLFDEEATRRAIIQKFEWLSKNVTPNDNVLIFYSGHGQFNKRLNKGYWVPVDAKSNSVADYISNNDVKTFLGGINSKHTLLITDACFAGEIFRGAKTESLEFDPNNMEKYYREVYRKPSRLALTSGGVEQVSDAGKDNHSIFTYYMLKALSGNKNKYIDATQLFNEFRVAVVNNSEQTPLLQVVRDTNDEGGQFVFVKKDNSEK